MNDIEVCFYASKNLLDGTTVHDVHFYEEVIFCRDEQAALQLIEDVNKAIQRSL